MLHMYLGVVPFIVGKIKPKLQFVISQSFATIALVAIGTYSLVKESSYLETSQLGWIPLASVVVSVLTKAAGSGPVLKILLNESYPTEIRTLSIGITISIALMSGTVCVKVFPALRNMMTMGGICLLYASFSLMVTIWGALTIPDNRGKSLVKVEESHSRKTQATQQISE